MPKGILLQPANIKNKLVKKHLEKTIFQTVELTEILRFQPKVNAEKERFYVWGVIPATKSKWEKLQIGDLVAFYSERKFYLLGQIVDKFRNEKLARYLWNEDQKGRTWEYIYLIDPDSLIPIDIDLKDVITILGYSSNFVLQSALYHQSRDLFDLFTNRLIEEESSTENIITIVERERISVAVKMYVRDSSFSRKIKQNYEDRCVICEVPNEGAIVDAAHVKPVKDGGPDIEENGIALCKIHHHLFDAGLITIKDRILKVSPHISSQLKEHLMIKNFENKNINLVKISEEFLNWHYENVFKS